MTTTTNNTTLSTTTTNPQEITTVSPTIIVEQCSSCKSTKKRVPLFLDNQENDHITKKPNLSLSTTHLTTQFTNIHISAPDTLRRTFSAPISPPQPTFINPFSPENDNNNNNNKAFLQRCVSDPTPVLVFPVTSPESMIGTTGNSSATETPTNKSTASLPPLRKPMLRRRRRIESERKRKKSGDISSEEKVKKMKEIIGVTSQFLSRIVQEDVENQGSHDIHHVAQNPKEENVGERCEPDTEEEAVSVEKTGECLVIQFKCNCSKTYQILLYGDACYYKLM